MAQDGETLDKPRGVWWNASDYPLPSAIRHQNRGRSLSANLTNVLSPTTTNEALFTFSKLWLDITHVDPEAASLSRLGFPDFHGPWGPRSTIIPALNNQGASGGSLMDVLGNDVYAYNSSLMLTDTFTKVLNTHAIKAGFNVERARKDQNFTNSENVMFTYSESANGGTGDAFADVLTGRPGAAFSGTPARDGHFQLWNLDFFVQDSWKVRKNLTLEYGLRFSKMTNNVERAGMGAYFDPSRYDPSRRSYRDDSRTYLNGVAYAELGEADEALIPGRPLFVMPRLNFAYDVRGNGDLILRGGAGVFRNRPAGNAEYNVLSYSPYQYTVLMDSFSTQSYSGGILDYTTVGTADPFDFVSYVGTVSGSVTPESVDYPRYFTTSLSIGKRLPWAQFLEVGYVGTFGRHLLDSRAVNNVPEGALTAAFPDPVQRAALDGSVVSQHRTYPTLAYVSVFEYNGTSNYHSLQATLSRQTSGRFQYFLTYTFSKALGTTNSESDDIDPFDARHRSYGILAHDRTHVANLSWSWILPDGTSGKNRFLRGLLNGWQLSGISSYQSGIPMMKLGLAGDISNDRMQQSWFGTPDVMGETPGSAPTIVYSCNPQLGNTGLGEKLLDVGCIGIPAFGETGNWVPPYYLRTPSRNSHDVTVFKNFGLGGSRRLQLRAGVFNVFNQAWPTVDLGYSDLDLTLQTECNVKVDNVPNGAGGTAYRICDPTQGFHFTEQTLSNFGKIISKRGHRLIEFAVKVYF